MVARDWVGVVGSLLEAGVSALAPGAGHLVAAAGQALEPDMNRLRQWRQDRAERERFLASVTMWADGRRVGEADVDLGLLAAADLLRQRGASLVRVAELNLDASSVAREVLDSSWHPQQALSAEAREVCAYAVQVFYQRLISENTQSLQRAKDQVLLARTDELGAAGRRIETRLAQFDAPPGPAGPVRVGEIPGEPPAFLGRPALDELGQVLRDGAVGVVCAVTGLRGVGKTQLAAAYARARIAEGWGLVGWVDAETENSLLGGLARVAEALGVGDPDGDSARSAKRLRDHLQGRDEPGLLVLDNATDPARVHPLLPGAANTQVLITTTDRAFIEFGTAIDVDVFTLDESAAYLQERTLRDDASGAAALAEQLGWLPLALAQAAPVIRAQNLTFASYAERLAAVPVEALLAPTTGQAYTHSTAAALLMAAEQVERPDPDGPLDAGGPDGPTGRIMRVVALLSPDGVDRALLHDLALQAVPASDHGAGPDDAWQVDVVLGRCASASVLTWTDTGDAVLMHRLLARVLRDRDNAAGRLHESAIAALELLEARLFDKAQAWHRRTEGAVLVGHVEALWENAPTVWDGDRELARRALGAREWAVLQLIETADLTGAISLGTAVRADAERLLGPSDPATLASLGNLAYAYVWLQRLEEAIPLLEEALSSYARQRTTDDPNTLALQHNLAHAYAEADRLAEAIPLFERTVADRERVLGLDHPDTLTSRNFLAHAYAQAGGLAEAILLFEETVAVRERVMGLDHPDTLNSRNDIALAYLEAGRLREAIPLLERTVTDFERRLAPDHPHTLNSRHNLAHAYRLADRLREAIPLLKRSLIDTERVLGPGHPYTLTARRDLREARRTLELE